MPLYKNLNQKLQPISILSCRTLTEILMQRALSVAVNWQECSKMHLPITCIIFDHMVFPCILSNFYRLKDNDGIVIPYPSK